MEPLIIQVENWASLDALRNAHRAELFMWGETSTAWFMDVKSAPYPIIYQCKVDPDTFEMLLTTGEFIMARPFIGDKPL